MLIHGIDFSGARDAGKWICIASGDVEGDALCIFQCRWAKDLPLSGSGRQESLAALCRFIASERDAIFGLDFPFGLPHALISEGDWEGFVRSFLERCSGPKERCSDPKAFRTACREKAGGRELKRHTDSISRAPFSPYNLRLYRQTYFGIRDVLGPLVRRNLVCVLPMQRPLPDRPRIVEVCPASTLKREKLYVPYKGSTPQHYKAREHILQEILRAGTISIPDAVLQRTMLEDFGGDALDSVVAVVATFRAVRSGCRIQAQASPLYAVEGYIYV